MQSAPSRTRAGAPSLPRPISALGCAGAGAPGAAAGLPAAARALRSATPPSSGPDAESAPSRTREPPSTGLRRPLGPPGRPHRRLAAPGHPPEPGKGTAGGDRHRRAAATARRSLTSRVAPPPPPPGSERSAGTSASGLETGRAGSLAAPDGGARAARAQ